MSTYLIVEKLSKSYGTTVLFKDVSFQISEGQKIALISKNGAGKTSFIRILQGKDTPDEGKIIFSKDIKVGFLEQEPLFNPDHTILEEVLSRSGEYEQVIKLYEEAVLQNNELILQKAIEKMDLLHAWDFEAKMQQILGKLNINNFNKKMGQLSGGEKKRVALASALLSNPNMLILDEPTNHLDLEMIEWLEEYLLQSNITLFMVTHDRYFLDRVCNEIIELHNGEFIFYKGNYSYFLEKRNERLEILESEINKARNLYRKELEWIRRMPQARGTKAKYRINAFEEIKSKAFTRFAENQIEINTQSARLGNKILILSNINKSYHNQILIQDLSYQFSRNEKVGIVGKNGSGKTTFLNIITETIKPDSGIIEKGETLKIGYFKQEGMQFDENLKVIEAAQQIAEIVTLSDGKTVSVSQFLNQFLFTPETQYTPVYKLSGGEKRRLYLATILMKNPNFLILDEPTNDLDIPTLNILEEYLQQFQGCVVIVSHDRYFLDKIVDHIFVFQGNGIIKDFPGNYSDYRLFVAEQERNFSKEEKNNNKSTYKDTRINKSARTKISYKEQREFEELTKEIEQLENLKKLLEEELSSGKLSGNEIVEKSKKLNEIIQTLEQKTERWLEISITYNL